jgi:hypothetical protein
MCSNGFRNRYVCQIAPHAEVGHVAKIRRQSVRRRSGWRVSVKRLEQARGSDLKLDTTVRIFLWT